MTAPDSSGVHLPPPLIFLALFGAAVVLDSIFPLPEIHRYALPAGSALFVAGLIPLVWALVRFIRSRVDPLPNRQIHTLVREGPYRFTRNPMYLGMLLLYIGGALLMQLVWALMLVPLVIFAVNRLVIFREEAYLERRFGSEYGEYRARVRRWL